jgi:hypothetical protein
MIKLPSINNRLFVQLSIAVGSVLVLSLTVLFLNSHITKQVEQMASQKRDIALRNRTIELLAGGNSDLKRAEPLLARLQSILPAKDTLLSFSRDVKAFGKQFDVTVGFSFGVEKAGTEAEPGTVNFSLSASGEYDNLMNFLGFLENHPYFIRFDGVSLGYQKDAQYTISTSGVIFTK